MPSLSCKQTYTFRDSLQQMDCLTRVVNISCKHVKTAGLICNVDIYKMCPLTSNACDFPSFLSSQRHLVGELFKVLDSAPPKFEVVHYNLRATELPAPCLTIKTTSSKAAILQLPAG